MHEYPSVPPCGLPCRCTNSPAAAQRQLSMVASPEKHLCHRPGTSTGLRAVKRSGAAPNAAAEAGERGQKGSAGLGDALQKRGPCGAACACIPSAVGGGLRPPPFCLSSSVIFQQTQALG